MKGKRATYTPLNPQNQKSKDDSTFNRCGSNSCGGGTSNSDTNGKMSNALASKVRIGNKLLFGRKSSSR